MQRIISIFLFALAGFALSACSSDSDGQSGAAFGEACTGSNECASGICVLETGTCTQRCEAGTMACPAGYVCGERESTAGTVYICVDDHSGFVLPAVPCGIVVTQAYSVITHAGLRTASCAFQSKFAVTDINTGDDMI